MRNRPVDRNPIARLNVQLKDMHLRLRRMRNEKNPTVEILDLPDNPPAVSIEGELAQDTSGKLWWYIEGEWRTC